MNMKTDENTNSGLIDEIERQTRDRVDAIKNQAKTQAEQIILEAKKQAEEIIKTEKEKIQRLLEVMKQNAEIALKLETRKMYLELKKKFADSVIEKVRQSASSLRGDPKEYRTFLKKAVIEGIIVVDSTQIIVNFSPKDKIFFDDEMRKEIEETFKKESKKNVSVSFVEGDFQDVGVIVCSADGFIVYENTFSARLKRMYETIYSELLSEEING